MERRGKDHSPFRRLWVITRTQRKGPGGRWTTMRRFYFGDCTWLFRPSGRNPSCRGDCSCSGQLVESFSGGGDRIAGYAFFPQDTELYVDCSDYCGNGFMWACQNDIYRVRTQRNTLILYSPGSGTGEGDYPFRIILKRNSLKNRLAANITAHFLSAKYYHKPGSPMT